MSVNTWFINVVIQCSIYFSNLVQERDLRASKPDMTDEEVQEELQITVLADLQEKQTTENKVIQSLIQQQVSSRSSSH